MRHYLLPVLGVSCLMLTGCIDNSYDLSDIDTTTEIKVTDLVLPINIDDVTLSDIISLDETGKVKIVEMDGKKFYAISQTGEFNSSPIKIEKITADAPVLQPSYQNVTRSDMNAPARRVAANTVTYYLDEMKSPFTFRARNVDKAIVSLQSALIDNLNFSIKISAQGLSGAVTETSFENIELELPKGLDVVSVSDGTYDSSTGLWTIPSLKTSTNSAEVTLIASGVDFAANGAILDDKTRSFTFNGSFNVNKGTVALVPAASASIYDLPANFDVKVEYKLGDLTVKAISGEINYKIDGVKIDPIWLTNIPDFFQSDDTKIVLTNPQIYMSLNNPIAVNGLDYSAGLKLTAVRPEALNIPDFSYTLNNGSFTVGHAHGENGPYNFVLSPLATSLQTPESYKQNLIHVPFSSLSEVLCVPSSYSGKGGGIPQRLLVELTDPQIPLQKVTDFELGRTISAVKGKYELMAPLQFTGGMIVYTDSKTGWDDEDVQAMVIDKLTVTADADNNCPLTATVTVYPLGLDGNRIPGVELKSNTLKANTKGQPLEFALTGEIKDLDGLSFLAVMLPTDDGETLTPEQNIVLKNIKLKVNGKYVKEL